MDWITVLIDRINEILLYIVPGYIFISIFDFILFKEKSNNEDNHSNLIILKSIALSYFLKLFYDKIITLFFPKYSIKYFLYMVISVIVSSILAYLLAIFLQSKILKKILRKIRIRRPINSNIWLDVVSDGCWLRVFLKDEQKSYLGICILHESHKNEPIVVLTKYQILNEYEEVVCDYSNDNTRKIVLNLKDFERVEVVDAPKKQKCKGT